MRPLRVAVRADASSRIGTGHIVRCLALARALRDAGAELCFIVRTFDVEVSPILKEFSKCLIRLPPVTDVDKIADAGSVPHAEWAGVHWSKDAQETVLSILDFSPTHLIVDHYAFDARWHRCVMEALDCALIVIDDLADRDLEGSLLIDHNLCSDHRIKYEKRWPSGRPIFGGPSCALLDESYVTASRACVRPQVDRLGIFMGGVDAAGYSERVLRACREYAGYCGVVEIATTSANPALESLKAACRPWPPSYLTIDSPNLSAFHASQDLEIGAGGGASWERCCIGVPTLLIATAENQRSVVNDLREFGAVASTLPAAFPDEAAIGRAVLSLINDPDRRASISEKAKSLVDGLGAWRAAVCIARENLELRPATLDDATQIYSWRNSATVRAVSGDPSEIPWERHIQWREKVIEDRNRTLMIALIGTRSVGVIRFDYHDDGYHELSLFLDPALQGLGLGTSILCAGERAMGSGARFRARVVAGNRRSSRLFASCGYTSTSPGVWVKEPAMADRRGADDSNW